MCCLYDRIRKTAENLLLLWPPCFHTPDALGYAQQLVAAMQQVVMPNGNITEEEEHASRQCESWQLEKQRNHGGGPCYSQVAPMTSHPV